MATLDIITLKGGSPANFLDVGGGASEEQVQKAFELLNADKTVKTILVNIFGGIMRCDVIALGIINAAKNIGMKKPIIIRLKGGIFFLPNIVIKIQVILLIYSPGTNVEEAKKLIASCGFRFIVTDDLEDAASKAVNIANIVSQAEDVKLNVEFY
jgi:succinyl-CoA synthetase beta subunit